MRVRLIKMSKVYLINTNIKNNPSCEQDMTNNAKCSAYYSPWKYYIEEIEAHDIVFLYSSGKGIIARGIATGIIEKNDYENHEDEEFHMNLDRFEIMKTAVTASKVKEIIGVDKLLLNITVVSLPYRFGIKVWQYMTKNCIEERCSVSPTYQPS